MEHCQCRCLRLPLSASFSLAPPNSSCLLAFFIVSRIKTDTDSCLFTSHVQCEMHFYNAFVLCDLGSKPCCSAAGWREEAHTYAGPPAVCVLEIAETGTESSSERRGNAMERSCTGRSRTGTTSCSKSSSSFSAR